VVGLLVPGCGSSGDLTDLGAEERFNLGKRLYDEEDYLEAINEFQIVKLQYPGSSVADDAQFYMGEARFSRGEYLLAIEDFRTLKRNMGSSPLVPLAQFKIGMCYYMLSPRSDLDQSFSRQAIEEFQTYVEYYPLDDRRNEAEDKIAELNGRQAKKLFDSAKQYMKLGYLRSATVYYDLVVQQYHDSPYAEPALVGKIESLVERKRFNEASEEITRFIDRYPESLYMGEVDGYRARIEGDDPETSEPGLSDKVGGNR
jgi:outer membrane protein assembly factor BamD